MKSDINSKILKLSIAEIVMQCGFERISEQALNILGDIFKFYSEQVLLRIKKMGELHSSFDIAQALINDFLGEGSYQEKELISFLNTQLSLKKALGVKEDDECLLHTLKVIPKSVDLTNVCRSTSTFSLIPNLRNGQSNLNLEIDKTMHKFIKECSSEKSRREKVGGGYKFNLLEIIEESGNKIIVRDHEPRERRRVFRG